MKTDKARRPFKGASIIEFPETYVVVDLETTGLSPEWDSIIEIGAIKVKSGNIIDTYQQLINPGFKIDDFIQNLTGITNEMLHLQPNISCVLSEFEKFVENNIVVGHNVNFDINFLYENFTSCLNKPFTNGYVDTMRIARKVLPGLDHYRLSDVVEELGIEGSDFHRALSDCEYTYMCYESMKALIEYDFGGFKKFKSLYQNKYHEKTIDLTKLTLPSHSVDPSNPLYNKVCVFTGTLERFSRQQAAQIVVNFGGTCANNVTKKTNYLIMGNNDYCSTIKGGKSSKQKKAEEYKLKGQDIEILPESVFYEMIKDE